MAWRLVAGVHGALLEGDRAIVVDAEEQRPYYEYAELVTPDESLTEDLALMASPILKDPVSPALQAWFFEHDDIRSMILNENSDLGDGEALPDFERAREDLLALYGSALADEAETDLLEISMITAAVHANGGHNEDCLRDCLPLMRGLTVIVEVSRFELFLYRDAAGGLRLAALRHVFPAETISPLGHGIPKEVPKGGRCLDPLSEGFHYVQGFFIDPDWLFAGLAEELAPLVLDEDARLATGSAARQPAAAGELKRPLDLVELLDVRTAQDLVLPGADLAILVDTTAPLARFRASILRFGAVCLVMVLSLGTGMVLLLGNVRARLEQARRTENFVAAVTHELRTPLASIRLHGEMLLDGIASTAEARTEYYRRILGETERLGLLVENVLQKSSLDSEAAGSAPGDLSQMVELMREQVSAHGAHYAEDEDTGEVTFDLAADLPEVPLHWDAIEGILRNLVGNARKYGGGEVLVRTRRDAGEVILEVLDRGPGVQEGEEQRIFEAFYRTGDEATRERPGTGLGLHLVELHADALGAEARYRHREGGGAAFQVVFPPGT